MTEQFELTSDGAMAANSESGQSSEGRPAAATIELDRRALLQRMTALAAAGALGPWVMQPSTAAAVDPSVINHNHPWTDARWGSLKDYDGYFPWTPPASLEAWAVRAEQLQRRVLVACGLWPMPEKPPIEATIHGLVDCDDHTVERVYFESSPGLYVTGSLYRPKGFSGPRPTVLCPHGHWKDARFYHHTAGEMERELASGGEKFPECGKYILQAKCVQLARMGCVVFLYDMLGYSDSQVLSQELLHGFGKQRPELSSTDNWGLYSAQSELRLVNGLGLQTWNSVRVVDWITTLPDVDPERIGVTGASGGGTQTFVLGMVDPRPTALFPVVMVSTSMQGGCTCENASLLRVETGNIEFVALLGPRPVGMIGADDWTVEIESRGLPELKQHYQRLGVPENVQAWYHPFPHNYNQIARQHLYEFMNKHLEIGAKEPIAEREFRPLTRAELTVWNDQHPAPSTGVAAERRLITEYDRLAMAPLQPLLHPDAKLRRDRAAAIEWFREFERVVGGGWDVLLGRKIPEPGSVEESQRGTPQPVGDARFHRSIVKYGKTGEVIPVVYFMPKAWQRRVTILLDDAGKKALVNESGQPTDAVKKLLAAGHCVVGVDVYGIGEAAGSGGALDEAPVVPNPRQFVGYTLGYNHSTVAQRVHDVLSVLAFFRDHPAKPTSIAVAGRGLSSIWAAGATVQSGSVVQKLAVSSDAFRFADITQYRDLMLVPGALKYGDVDGLFALAAGRPLWVHAAQVDQALIQTAAFAAGRGRPQFAATGTGGPQWGDLVDWLVASR